MNNIESRLELMFLKAIQANLPVIEHDERRALCSADPLGMTSAIDTDIFSVAAKRTRTD